MKPGKKQRKAKAAPSRDTRAEAAQPGLAPGRERALALLLLLALAALLGLGVVSDGLTNDEVMYIGAGYRHLTARDFFLNTEQPPLAKLLGALPLSFLSLREPPRSGDPWQWAHRFVVVENDGARVITWARLPNVLLTLLLALLLWRFGRAAYGPVAGLIALTLCTFDTSLLAHGHLMTTDIPGAVTMLAASWAYWRFSRAPSVTWALAVAAAMGVVVVTRLTGWALLPAFAFLEIAQLVTLPREARRKRLTCVLALVAFGAVILPVMIWAAYGFRFEPWPGESVAWPPSRALGLAGKVMAFGLAHRLLPEAYLEGARFVAQHNLVGHPTYLLGHVEAAQGAWYYHLVAFLLKNTPGFLVASAIGLAALLRRRALRPDGAALHAAVPAALIFAAATLGRVQIGERYILSVHPYLILIACAPLARLWTGARGRIAVVILLLAHAVPALWQAPRGWVPYFNFLAGGTDGGYRYLADSNLDWGQDLPRLAAWMRAKGVEKIQLAYHGPDLPDRFGIRHEDLEGIHFYPPRPPERPFRGTVAISPNLWLGIYNGGHGAYEFLRARPPDDRAGVYFIYRFPE